MRKWIMLLENLFAWSEKDQSQLWVCTQVVSIARGRKSKIRFHRAFIHNRKKGKINKAQQGLRAASNCQATEKARRCEGKKWSWSTKGSKTVVKRICLKKHADLGYLCEPQTQFSLTGARDFDFQCWKYRPVKPPHGSYWKPTIYRGLTMGFKKCLTIIRQECRDGHGFLAVIPHFTSPNITIEITSSHWSFLSDSDSMEMSMGMVSQWSHFTGIHTSFLVTIPQGLGSPTMKPWVDDPRI